MISSEFHYFLNHLAAEKEAILASEKKLLSVQESSQRGETTPQTIETVFQFLNANQTLLKKGDLPKLDRIKAKLLKGTKKDDERAKIESLYSDLVKKVKQAPATSTKSAQRSDLQTVVEVSPAATNPFLLAINLRMVLENFPKYLLGEDLAVYDSTHGNAPPAGGVLAKLEEELQEVEEPALKEMLTDEIAALKKLLKPIVPVKMQIVIETNRAGDPEKVMFKAAVSAAQDGLPVVMTKTLLHAHLADFAKEFSDKDLYVMNPGSLLVVFSKGQEPEAWGFSKKQLILWQQGLEQIHDHPLDFNHDLPLILVNEDKERRFKRLVALTGHGSYPTSETGTYDPASKGIIAGLKEPTLQKALEVLNEQGMLFLFLTSCYAGGVNMSRIHAPDGSIPCPILVSSAAEAITDSFTVSPTKQLLERAEEALQLARTAGPRPITQAKAKAIAGEFNQFLGNVGSFLAPRNRGDLPLTLQSALAQGTVFDVSDRFRQARRLLSSEKKIEELEDDQSDRLAFFFSDDLLPCKLKIKTANPPILLSRGATNHHYIQEMEAANCHWMRLLETTFNAYGAKNWISGGPASKAIFIGQLQSKYQRKMAVLENVMLIQTATEARALFRLSGEKDYRMIQFEVSNRFPAWQTRWGWSGKVAKIPAADAELDLLASALRTDPDFPLKKAHLEFYETLINQICSHGPPEEKELYLALLDTGKQFVKEGSRVFETTRLDQALKAFAYPRTLEKREALANALKLAEICDHAHLLAEKIQKATLPPLEVLLQPEALPELKQALHHAVIQGDEALIRTLIAKGISLENKVGLDLLKLAFSLQKREIAKLLIEQKAGEQCLEPLIPDIAGNPLFRELYGIFEKNSNRSVNEKSLNGETALHLASLHPERAEWLITKGADIFSRDNVGLSPLARAARLGDVSFMHLLEKRVGLNESELREQLQDSMVQAIRFQQGAICDNLLEHYADKLDLFNVLLEACKWNQENIGDLIIQNPHFPKAAQEAQGPLLQNIMIEAVQKEYIDILAFMLDHYADKVNLYEVFLESCKADNMNFCFWIVKRPEFKVNTLDPKTGMTPLQIAVRYGDEKLVKHFLSEGADPLAKNKEGKTALELAKGGPRLKFLLDQVKSLDEGLAMQLVRLHYPESDQVEALQRIVEKYAVFLKEQGKLTPEHPLHLFLAILKNERREAEAWLTKHPHTSTLVLGLSAIHAALLLPQDSAKAAIELLKSHGVDLNQANFEGNTPFHRALYLQNKTLSDVLLEAGCRVDTRNSKGHTPASESAYRGFFDILSKIEQRTALAKGAEGSEVIYQALNQNRPDIAERLLAAGLEEGGNIKDILELLIIKGHKQMFLDLIQKPGYLDDPEVVHSCIKESIYQEDPEYLKKILEKVGDLSKIDRLGKCSFFNRITSTSHKPGKEDPSLMELLLKHGCDINAQDGDIKVTPLHQALENRRFHMVEWLLDHDVRTNLKNREGIAARELLDFLGFDLP